MKVQKSQDLLSARWRPRIAGVVDDCYGVSRTVRKREWILPYCGFCFIWASNGLEETPGTNTLTNTHTQ